MSRRYAMNAWLTCAECLIGVTHLFAGKATVFSIYTFLGCHTGWAVRLDRVHRLRISPSSRHVCRSLTSSVCRRRLSQSHGEAHHHRRLGLGLVVRHRRQETLSGGAQQSSRHQSPSHGVIFADREAIEMSVRVSVFIKKEIRCNYYVTA